MTEALWEFLRGFSEVWYPVILGLTAMVETVFPPFPGDVIYIAFSGLGWNMRILPVLLWLPGFAGCFLSTVLLDSVGRSPGLQKLEKLVTGTSRSNGTDRARRIISRHGSWVLVASRFIPGVRSLLVVVAASSGMKRSRVLISAGASAALWYMLMTAAGYFAGTGLEDAENIMSGLTYFIAAVLVASLLAGTAVMLYRLKRS